MLRDCVATNNLANRFLLIIDNAPSHPRNMEDRIDNIEVMFLPLNCTYSGSGVMDQDVIATFKTFYQSRTIKQLITAIDGEGRPKIKQFWAKCDIKAIDNINESWMEIKEQTVNGCWRQIWEECVTDFKGFTDMADVRRDIVHLSHLAGFTEVDELDVEDFLESHDQPLSNEDLVQLEQERLVTEEEEEEELEPQRGLDIKTLREVFIGIVRSLEPLKECDPNPARSRMAIYAIDKALKVYWEIYDLKRRQAKQFTISSFFKPSASPVSPAANPDTPAAVQAIPATPAASPSISATASPPIPAIAGPSTSAAAGPSFSVTTPADHSSPFSSVDPFLISDDKDD
ncbi:tigger transposable element-derived protein 1-like [Scylla paramamosain]|uniref:tigger transposable element-derived protein 1-like n=1 Tax=Scylla paramamosain TaxID=85552 RepID=UPI003082E343